MNGSKLVPVYIEKNKNSITKKKCVNHTHTSAKKKQIIHSDILIYISIQRSDRFEYIEWMVFGWWWWWS